MLADSMSRAYIPSISKPGEEEQGTEFIYIQHYNSVSTANLMEIKEATERASSYRQSRDWC